jgi:choline dehydrogenase
MMNQHNETGPAQFDFIVCGSGSSGSVVAARLAENPDVRVLLIEAGGTDDILSVMAPSRWPENLGSERDWQFTAQPHRHVNGRATWKVSIFAAASAMARP